MAEQKDRLQSYYTDEYVAELEDEYVVFEEEYTENSAFKNLVRENSQKDTFHKRWQWLDHKFPKLVDFTGGLQTVFPGTATVEGDFRDISIEKDNIGKKKFHPGIGGALGISIMMYSI